MLNSILNHLDSETCKVDKTDPEIDDIEKTVQKMVRLVLNEVCNKQNQLRYIDLVAAGSFYEGTKVGFPDEFDFMVILDAEEIHTEPGCGAGLVNVILDGSKSWLTDVEDESSIRGGNIKTKLIQAFNTSFFETVLRLLEEGICVKGETGILYLDLPVKHMLQLKWIRHNSSKEKKITVDLMPAIKCPNCYIKYLADIGSLLKEQLEVVQNNGCYLVPKTCPLCEPDSCWHVSFAKSENYLIRGMDETHRACYRVLKYLMQIKKDNVAVFGGITSYVLKMAVLHHVYNWKCEANEGIGQCVISVLDYLAKCYEKLQMPLFFLKDWCMFRKGQIIYCKLNSLVFDSECNYDAPTRQVLFGATTNSLVANEDVQDCWLFLIWNEYTRRFLLLVQHILLTVGDIAGDGSQISGVVSFFDKFLAEAESAQPAAGQTFYLAQEEHLISSGMLFALSKTFIYEFSNLHGIAQDIFETPINIPDVIIECPLRSVGRYSDCDETKGNMTVFSKNGNNGNETINVFDNFIDSKTDREHKTHLGHLGKNNYSNNLIETNSETKEFPSQIEILYERSPTRTESSLSNSESSISTVTNRLLASSLIIVGSEDNKQDRDPTSEADSKFLQKTESYYRIIGNPKDLIASAREQMEIPLILATVRTTNFTTKPVLIQITNRNLIPSNPYDVFEDLWTELTRDSQQPPDLDIDEYMAYLDSIGV